MTVIKPKLKDNGGDGVFLTGNHLIARVGGTEFYAPIDDAFIHKGDRCAYLPHELDDHVDGMAIRRTVFDALEKADDFRFGKLDDLKEVVQETVETWKDDIENIKDQVPDAVIQDLFA